MFRAHALAEILGVAAHVEYLHLGSSEPLEQMRIGRENFRARIELEIRRRELFDLGG